MAATGLSADPTEYRARLSEQSDEQIDLWAQEMMRDVAKRRGVIRVLEDLRRAAKLSERDIERVFASGDGPPAVIGRDAQGRQMMPAVTLYALVPGIRARRRRRAPAPDRLPGRELRRARLRLTGASPGSRGSSGWSTHSRRSSTASSSRRSPSSPGRTRRAPSARRVDDGAPGVDRRAQRPPRRPRRCRSQARQADPGRAGERADRAGRRGRGSGARDRARGPGRCPGRGARGRRAADRLRLRPRVQGHGLVVAAVRRRDPDPAGLRLARGGGRTCRRSSSALVPMAVLAGAALAIANARADLERDVAAGTVSVATRLGLEGSWRLHAGLWWRRSSWRSAGWRSVGWDSLLIAARSSPRLASSWRPWSLVPRSRAGRSGARLAVRGGRGRAGPIGVAGRGASADQCAPER